MKKLENISIGEKKEYNLNQLIINLIDVSVKKRDYIKNMKYPLAADTRDTEKQLLINIYNLINDTNYGFKISQHSAHYDRRVRDIEEFVNRFIIDRFGLYPDTKQEATIIHRDILLTKIIGND